MSINRAKLDLIKQQVSMKDVARLDGLKVNRNGFACCPFHQEKTPSFRVYDGDGGFSCFGCNESGDIFDYIMKRYGMNLVNAAIYVDMMFGLNVFDGQTDTPSTREERRKAREKARIEREQREAEEKAKEKLEKTHDHICGLMHALEEYQDLLGKDDEFVTDKEAKEAYVSTQFLVDYLEDKAGDIWERLYVDKTWQQKQQT